MNSPFKLLGVGKMASKKDILRQVTVLMRSKQHDAKTLAEAQKALFNTTTRAAEEFKHFIDAKQLDLSTEIHQGKTLATAAMPDITLLDDFDGQAAAATKTN